MKQYLINENRLRELFFASALLDALECGGVDNWNYYDHAIQDYITSWAEDNLKNPDEDWGLEDIVDDLMKNFGGEVK